MPRDRRQIFQFARTSMQAPIANAVMLARRLLSSYYAAVTVNRWLGLFKPRCKPPYRELLDQWHASADGFADLCLQVES